MGATIDYYFSLVSPFTYLAGQRLEDIADRHAATVRYKPVKLGEVFAETGGLPLPKRSPQRRAYRLQELARWRDHLHMPLVLEPRHFPADETLAAHAVIAAQESGLRCGPLVHAILRAVWAEERDIADSDTLRDIIAGVGLDAGMVLKEAERPEMAEIRDHNTREAISRGVFGSPTFVLGDQIFWGQDRLDFLDRALAARPDDAGT